MVGQAQRFQLVVAKEVGLLDDYDGCASPFGLFSGQRVGGLGGQGGVVGQRLPTQRGHDAVVDAAHPDGGIGQVDDGVAVWSRRARAAHTHGLAGAHLAGNHSDAAVGDTSRYG